MIDTSGLRASLQDLLTAENIGLLAGGLLGGAASLAYFNSAERRRNESPYAQCQTQQITDERMGCTPARRPGASSVALMQRHYLMCRPTYFAVTYKINPWMNPEAPCDTSLAVEQWEHLKATYERLGHTVELIDPLPGLPDMVFAANGGTIVDGKMLTAQFRHAERADEGPAYRDWAERSGFTVHDAKHVNEGEGDLLLVGQFLLAGTGFRTAHAAHAEAQELFGRPVITLQLVDPRFYHLDTAIAVLSHGDDGKPANIAYLPKAFSPGSQAVLSRLFPDAIIADIADAQVLGLNAVSDGRNIVLPVQATRLAEQLLEAGYRPVGVDVSELRLAGGGPKCCTLELRA